MEESNNVECVFIKNKEDKSPITFHAVYTIFTIVLKEVLTIKSFLAQS